MATGQVSSLMRAASRWLPWMLLAAAAVAADRPETATKSAKAETAEEPQETAVLSLTLSQQQAVGIRIERPLPLTTAPQIEAYGTVLDPVALVSDLGRMESTQVAAAAVAADAARLERLYHDDTQASLKAVQASRAQSVEAAAQARAAALSFRLQWGPLASWSETQRRSLVDAAGEGRLLLLRADLPGQRISGAVDRHAVVEVDGVNVEARVLGALPRTDASSSTGWLLQLEHTPPGLGPGARAAVRLQATAAPGLLVPAEALLYSEHGTYVYCQQSAGSAGSFRYAAVTVQPVARVGNAWLVDGLEPTARVVVQGAGVLWSLQGIGTFSAAEEEHD